MTFILQTAVAYFANFLQIVIVIQAISSWLPIGRDNGVLKILYMLTEPILGPIRAAMRKSPLGGPGMMMDFSPVIALFLINVVENLLIFLIAQIPLV